MSNIPSNPFAFTSSLDGEFNHLNNTSSISSSTSSKKVSDKPAAKSDPFAQFSSNKTQTALSAVSSNQPTTTPTTQLNPFDRISPDTLYKQQSSSIPAPNFNNINPTGKVDPTPVDDDNSKKSDTDAFGELFSSLTKELDTVHDKLIEKQQGELDDMIYEMTKATKKTTIAVLPTQSVESKMLSETVMNLYKTDDNTKNKKIKSKKQKQKHEIAARQADARFDKLDAILNNTGPYKKALQNKRRKNKNMDW